MASLVERAIGILESTPLCDRCLGRCFARLSTGLGNDERGRALRTVAEMSQARFFEPPEICPICQNYFQQCEKWAREAAKLVENVEFRTYLIGTHPPAPIVAAERELHEAHWIAQEESEPFKQEFNRTTGKHFGQLMENLGLETTVDMSMPDVTFKIDLEAERVSLEIRSLFIYGRYCKYLRGIPQTQWPCRQCRGKGCEACKDTGKQYPESVGELVASPAVDAALGGDHAFHGAGREDVDALMLGSGRPFVLEVKRPHIRSLDLCALRAAINQAATGKIEVGELRHVDHKQVEKIKRTKARKSYEARIKLGREVTQNELDGAMSKLVGEIGQKTPQRVLHRRADLTRRRTLFAIEGKITSSGSASVSLTCDGGLYVKELISGDDGRTTPSLAELLETTAVVTELDVTDVDGPFPDSA